MTWLFAAFVVLLIGGITVVAAGRGQAMAEEYDDRPDVRVQADGPLTGEDLRAIRFTTALRGYRASEVDVLLHRLAKELDEARATRAEPDERSAPFETPDPPVPPVIDR